ncbi:hypothetical protein DFH09DRAFT_1072245 [Mycena vulgaris]|nr:hypothetical protein DFH09DRAFT_1072245 [Mycena vulgaris]
MHTSFLHVREGDQQFDASHLSFEPAQGTLKSSEASVTWSHRRHSNARHANNQSAKYPMEAQFVENTSLAECLWYEGAEKCRDQIPKLGLRFEAETQESSWPRKHPNTYLNGYLAG